MVGTLIVTHGGLAAELLAAGEIITGGLHGFEALALGWGDGFEEARAKIAESVARLDSGDGVIILTDMYGDTPSRAALSLAEPGRVEVVTGVNLPMVVRLGCLSGQDMRLEVLARWLAIKGRRAITRAAAAPAAVPPAGGGHGR
jgi:PTS system mannose-specific IIA component